jgi:ribosome-binding protein aMBF1 (putative translation factor)
MITPEQSRAARGWLDWTQADLAERAKVSLSTVRDFEKHRRVPIANNLDAIERVIRGQGIEPVDHEGRPAGILVRDASEHPIIVMELGKTPRTDGRG